MKLNNLKDGRLLCFVAGAAAVIAGKRIIKSEKTRKLCVMGIAKGMKLQQDALETFQNMKEEAEDMCYEAKSKLDEEDEVNNEI